MPKPRKTLTDYVMDAVTAKSPVLVLAELKLIINVLERMLPGSSEASANPARKRGRPKVEKMEGGGE